jgi:hypothetical protein
MKSENGCPFCQEKVIHIISSTPPTASGNQAECQNCAARGPVYDTEDEAIAGWEIGTLNLGERLRTDQ